MISIENSPSDPSSSSSCQRIDQNRVPQLLISSSNSTNSDEKKASTTSAYDNKLALVEEEQEEVDLLKSCVHDCNPPPEFSIRDYVYGLRSKDITKNWPFSEENLMLCLKHGVKNLLPPFQPLNSLKNPSDSEKSLPDDEMVVTSCYGKSKPSRQSHQFVSATSQTELYSGNNKLPKLGADSLVEVSKQKLDLELPSASQKAEMASQVKKGKMVKFSSVDPAKMNEDITPNNFMVSETTMASKVCPVCKTFTSSSNTTLNAHIDQCLSGESTMKWKANPKVIKNRVKPRRIRLMVDIYKTAPSCTVEELDRRNGTNWATNSSFHAQEMEFHGEEEREREQRVVSNDDNGVETGHEGDVYIDSDGTKVRILSVPKIRDGDDHGSQKLLKRKYPKFVAGKKEKKTREEKNHKRLKLSPHSKKLSSPKPRRGFAMRSNQEKNFSPEEDYQEEVRFQSEEEELELDDDQGAIKPWSCSRRSGQTKDSKYSVTRNSPVEKDQTSLENRNFSRTLSSSDNNPISSPESSERTDTSPYETRDDDDYVDQPLFKKRVENKTELMGKLNDPGDFVIGSNARKLSSLRKNVFSGTRNSMSELRSGVKRKFSALKKTRSVVGPSQVDRLRNQLQESRHVSQMVGASKKSNVMEIRKTRTGVKISGEQALYVQPKNSKVDDLLPDVESSGKEIETHDQSLSIEPRNYLNSEFDSQHSFGVYEGPFSEPERLIFSPQTSLDDRKKMFSEEDIGKNMNGEIHSKNEESDYKEMGHGVYFLEVERIPIPGPPGSFLPSPGADIVSEDVQGNSSLTNSRVQSSEDRLDLVDRDSMMDSPISATSTISNPTLTRSDSRSSEKLSLRSVAVVEENPLIQQAENMVGGERRTESPFPEKGVASGLRNDYHQPCCCSRKEGVAQSFASVHQESALLRRRTIEWNNNKRPVNSLTLKPDTFSLSNYPPEKAFVPPEHKSNAKNAPVTAPADTPAASPSSSNPVLRLMGKDLMVVKKDKDVATTTPQLTPPPQSSSFDHHPNRQFFTTPTATPGNIQNQDHQSLHHQVFHSSFDPEQQNVGFRSYAQPQTPQTPIHALERSFTNSTMLPGGYMTSNSYSLSGSHSSFMPQAPPDRSNNNYARPKEIIVIDDSPENEADLVHNGSMRNNGVHFPSGYNPRHMNSFYNNQSHGSFSYGGSKDASFPRPVSREMINASPPVWNRVPEGSSVVAVSREMNTSAGTAVWNLPEGGISSLAAAAHQRSTTYYPPRFS